MNKKIIRRAIATSLVRDTPDTLKLIRKYQPISKNISYLDLLMVMQSLLATNPSFTKDYYLFLIEKKRIEDYNFHFDSGKSGVGGSSVSGGGFMSMMGGILSGGAIGSAIGLISGGATRRHESAMMNQQVSAQNTQAMMNMMMQEDAMVAQEKKQANTLVIGAVIAMMAFTGFLIYLKKK